MQLRRFQEWAALGARGAARMLLQASERGALDENSAALAKGALAHLEVALAKDGSDRVTGEMAEARIPACLINGLNGLANMIRDVAAADFKPTDEWVANFDVALEKLRQARLRFGLESRGEIAEPPSDFAEYGKAVIGGARR